MTKKEEKEKVVEKCAHQGCSDDATWKGTSTKKSIESFKDDNEVKNNRYLFKTGTWYYCDKHRQILEPYNPHLEFEKL